MKVRRAIVPIFLACRMIIRHVAVRQEAGGEDGFRALAYLEDGTMSLDSEDGNAGRRTASPLQSDCRLVGATHWVALVVRVK